MKIEGKTDKQLQAEHKELCRELNAMIDKNNELKAIKFVNFHNDECWIYAGDGNDHLESLVCPVVIRPKVLLDMELKIAELEAKQQCLDIPLFLRDPKGLAADVKAEFDKYARENQELKEVIKRLSRWLPFIEDRWEEGNYKLIAKWYQNEMKARTKYARKALENDSDS